MQTAAGEQDALSYVLSYALQLLIEFCACIRPFESSSVIVFHLGRENSHPVPSLTACFS